MGRYLITIALFLLYTFDVWGDDGDVFTAKTIEGVEMTFKVISETDKTCQVGILDGVWGGGSSISKDYTGDITIPSVANGYNVIRIGRAAFQGCKIKSIIIPSSIKAIYREAFSTCYALQSVLLPEGLEQLGGMAFNCCTKLESIEIPQSVQYIGGEAFRFCTSLSSITIPKNVSSIGKSSLDEYCHLFEGCNLNSIIVETGNSIYDSRNNSNAIIETETNKLLAGCKNTIIPESVTSIESYAFYRCTGLSTILIPNSITSIGRNAFSGCTNLTTIDIPKSISSISIFTFEDCSSLYSVTIPENVISIGKSAFNNCSNLSSVTIKVSQPLPIEESTFSNRSNATLIVPYDSKTAYAAAKYWKDFKEITEETKPSIINFADANVKAICVANWDTDGDGELSEDEAALVTDLGMVFVDKSITSFNELQFFKGLEQIGAYAFRNCNSLTSLIFPNGNLISIGEDAFCGCTSLTAITLPNSVTVIGDGAFRECANLKTITLPNELSSIETYSFYECTSLTSIDLPNSITYIEESAFRGCTSLKTIALPENLVSIDNDVFQGCSSLASITIPSSVTSIGGGAFDGCISLTSIEIPKGITSIYDGTFNNCGLISIKIPQNVSYIGSFAFARCISLSTIVIESGNPIYE